MYLLQDIARSPFDDAINAARTISGGVRGYPLLRNMKSRLQLPVLHCTGNIAEVITYFVLECLPEVVQNDARASLLAITGKGKMDALYLREYRELVAHTAARPAIFLRDLDCVFVIVLQLTQLLNAAWRGSLTDEEVDNRDGAGSIARLTASNMGPLCREVKPLDPRTKDAKVLTLYMHALSHTYNNKSGTSAHPWRTFPTRPLKAIYVVWAGTRTITLTMRLRQLRSLTLPGCATRQSSSPHLVPIPPLLSTPSTSGYASAGRQWVGMGLPSSKRFRPLRSATPTSSSKAATVEQNCTSRFPCTMW